METKIDRYLLVLIAILSILNLFFIIYIGLDDYSGANPLSKWRCRILNATCFRMKNTVRIRWMVNVTDREGNINRIDGNIDSNWGCEDGIHEIDKEYDCWSRIIGDGYSWSSGFFTIIIIVIAILAAIFCGAILTVYYARCWGSSIEMIEMNPIKK